MGTADRKRGDAGAGDRVADSANALLVEAGAVLATSLDPQVTMAEVAALAVPSLADLCTIDVVDADGTIKEAAAAASEAGIAPALEALRAKHPLDPDGDHPVARVIRTGQPQLEASMDARLLRSFAQGSEHAKFMLEHRYSSAAVAPLLARGRTLGALSALRLGDAEPYDEADLALIRELARRAGLAIDNARLFSDLRRIEQRLEAILVNLAEAVMLVDDEGKVVFANAAAAALLEASSPSELVSGERAGIAQLMSLSDESGSELEPSSLAGRRLFGRSAEPGWQQKATEEQVEPLVVRATVAKSGAERWLRVRSSPLDDPETGRVRWYVHIFEDITEMKRAQQTEAFLASASAAISSSIDFDETVNAVAMQPVGELADWCAVELYDERGALVRAAEYPQGADGEDASRVQTCPESEPAAAKKGETAEASEISVPLLSTHRELGAIVLRRRRKDSEGNGCASVPFTVAERTLAEELGRRAGDALEHARLYTERTRIAHTLQQALLPSSLPEIPGVEVHVRYTAAGELNEAGGDFYDVIDRGAGDWLLVIGDVCGKGPQAASVTALARHTLRAAAIAGAPPLRMLHVLHEALKQQPIGADLCTVCLVGLRPGAAGGAGDGRGTGDVPRTAEARGAAALTVTLAGHSPPLLISANGEARPLGQPGTLLGVIDPIRVSEHPYELAAGETLLLYTDGVAEAGRSSGALSERGLLQLCRDGGGLTLAELLEMIERAAVQRAEGMRRDDIALLGVRTPR